MDKPEKAGEPGEVEELLGQTLADADLNNSDAIASMFALELDQIQTLQRPSSEEIQSRWVFLGPQTKRTTLILDLDETLVAARNHATKVPNHSMEILLRPYVQQVLLRLNAIFEIVVFTAAEPEYAKQIVDYLDPEGKFVKQILTRDHCVPLSNGWPVKDLRIFADRQLHQLLIVDNSILSFAFQLANGIPVSSYNGDPEDQELLFLADYLERLNEEADIVQANEAYIGLTACFK